jgi:hypothetical protein
MRARQVNGTCGLSGSSGIVHAQEWQQHQQQQHQHDLAGAARPVSAHRLPKADNWQIAPGPDFSGGIIRAGA